MNVSSANTAQAVEAVDTVAIAANLDAVRRRMAAAAQRAGRNPADVTLVAVSKSHPAAAVRAALAHGQRDFGENRFEEAREKAGALEGEAGAIRWHFVGTIQSRKTGQALGIGGRPFALVHAVDRVKIADRLDRDAKAAGCVVSVLLEVNVSGEASKHGFTPGELRAALPRLAALGNLRMAGLMTMAPFVDDPEEARPVFRALRELRDELATTRPGADLHHLSMGMTNDFEVAIEEGATIVRVGTAIFGNRLIG
jgi:pyridoxal phosphate enzyme (YggS family)